MTRWHHPLMGRKDPGATRRADPKTKSSKARSGGSRTSDILPVDVAGPEKRSDYNTHLTRANTRHTGNEVWILQSLPGRPSDCILASMHVTGSAGNKPEPQGSGGCRKLSLRHGARHSHPPPRGGRHRAGCGRCGCSGTQ